MAITGPLGLRYNQWRRINNEYVLTSPTRGNFKWQEGIVWAECNRCPMDEEEHILIRESCSCGIYATVNLEILAEYKTDYNSVICLIEALDANLTGFVKDKPKGGYIWLHAEDKSICGTWYAGWTAPGAAIVHLVEPYYGFERSIDALAAYALAVKFHTSVITFDEAMWMCQKRWNECQLEQGELTVPWDGADYISKKKG